MWYPVGIAPRMRLMLTLMSLALLPLSTSLALSTPKGWDVTLCSSSGERRTLHVPDGCSVLSAAEAAGLLPGSDCRRGRCLSCAARVKAGAPFSLRVASDTSLCDEAHAVGIVLLCSAYACGPGLELQLGAEGDVRSFGPSLLSLPFCLRCRYDPLLALLLRW